MTRSGKKALALYERELVRLNYAPSSVALLVSTARRFVAFLGKKKVWKATVEDVRAYLASRAEVLSARTHASELARLRTFFRLLLRAGALDVDPAQAVTVEQPARVPQLLLGDASVAKLLAAASDGPRCRRRSPEVAAALRLRDRALLELLYALGPRASEARAALVVDLRLAEGTLLLRRAKRGKPAELPLPPRSIPHLERWLVGGRPVLTRSGLDQGRLLLTHTGKPLNKTMIGDMLRRIRARTGVRSHPHAFRRAVASHMVRDGVSVLAVRELLGHERLSTTAVYTEVGIEELRRAVERLEPETS